MKLPIALEKSVYREYVTEESELRDEDAFLLLGDALNPDETEAAEISDISFKTGSDSNFAYAQMRAECIEPIGIKKEILKIG